MELLKLLGIITYILIFTAIMLGIFRKKLNFKIAVKWHIALGILALILATIHAVLVIMH